MPVQSGGTLTGTAQVGMTFYLPVMLAGDTAVKAVLGVDLSLDLASRVLGSIGVPNGGQCLAPRHSMPASS